MKSGLFIGKKRYSKSDYTSLAAMIAKLCGDGYSCGMFDVIAMPEFNSENWTYYILFYATHDDSMVVVQAYRMLDRSIMMNTLKHDNTWFFPDWTTI